MSPTRLSQARRVCIIGAGPSGCSALFQFAELETSKTGAADDDNDSPEMPEKLVCYEKQDDLGGMWNFTPETGLDAYGDEPVHGCMYRHLWSNGPKELLELPEYTFDEHFGRPIPSVLPREAVLDYLKGRCRQRDIRKFIRFAHCVKSVVFDEQNGDFVVVVKDLVNDEVLPPERFSHVIVANGHYTHPYVPSIEGMDTFPGRVLHAKVFRDAAEFQGKSVLLIGAGYTAEDLALQLIKFGARRIVISWRTRPFGYKWPPAIEERPEIVKIQENVVVFKDESSVKEVDVVIFCTGYLKHYPFLTEEMKLKSKERWCTPSLYKGCLFLGGDGDAGSDGFGGGGSGDGAVGRSSDGVGDGSGCDGVGSGGGGVGEESRGDVVDDIVDDGAEDDAGNIDGFIGKLFYLGTQPLVLYTFTMFEQQALWTRNVIIGKTKLPERDVMIADAEKWYQDEESAKTKDIRSFLDFTADYVRDLCRENEYPHDLDATSCIASTLAHRGQDIATYRDQSHRSIVTGQWSPAPRKPFMEQFDDSLEEFLS